MQGEYGARVYAHVWEKPIVESQKAGFRAMLLDTGDFYKEIFGAPPIFYRVLLRYLGGKYNGLRVDEILNGGEELDFGLSVIACHTPGHSPGHMGYYIPEERVFVGGDLIDLETGEGADLNNPHSDYADGLTSLKKVRELDIEHFLPAHGEPVRGKDNVESLFDGMIANTHKYISDVTDFLSEREGTLTEMFKKLMPDAPFTLKAMKMMQILTTLKHLQNEGKVVLRRKGGKLVWSLSE